MEPITINVTQRHIDEGRANNCMECPVALACWSSVPDLAFVTVTKGQTNLTIKGMAGGPERDLMFTNPPEVREFIYKFDRKVGLDTIAPFSFVLDNPERDVWS